MQLYRKAMFLITSRLCSVVASLEIEMQLWFKVPQVF